MPQLTVDEVRALMPEDKDVVYLPATVLSNEIQFTTNGSPKMSLMLEINAGEHKGKHAYADLYFTPAAMEKTLEKMEKVFDYTGGIEGTYELNLAGRACKAQLKVEEYNGEDRVKCNVVKAGSDRKASPHAWREFMASIGKPMPKKPGPNKEVLDDDSLPF